VATGGGAQTLSCAKVSTREANVSPPIMFPFPFHVMLAAPTSEVQYAMKPWFLAVLLLQGVLVAGRVFIIDIWGSFILLMVIIVGLVTWRRNLDPLSCVSYGFMVLFTGLFDVVLLFERYSRIPTDYFSKERSMQYNVASAVFLAAPLLDFLGVYICWKVYTECDPPLLPDNFIQGPDYGSLPLPDENPQGHGSHGNHPGQLRGGFLPFSGRAFLLGK